MTARRKCIMCKTSVKGRSDKKFCSISCKNIYHQKLKQANESVTLKIDKILHRNRAILLEILGKTGKYKKITKMRLDQNSFNYTYCTGTHVNSQNKRVFHIYDFSYIVFSDQEVLIKRNTRIT